MNSTIFLKMSHLFPVREQLVLVRHAILLPKKILLEWKNTNGWYMCGLLRANIFHPTKAQQDVP